jgi:chorismate--pyruvate lyase
MAMNQAWHRTSDGGTEPAWRPVDGALRRRLPAVLRGWLIDTASLTERLQALCGPAFGVRLRRQGWRRPAFGERAALGMEDHRVALVREVHLLRGSTPLVFARTVMPAEALRGRGRRLARLGNRPLGALLFADPRIRRAGIEVARIRPGDDFHAAAIEHRRAERGAEIWGRRSLFLIGEQPLLVNEIFLPALLERER